MPKKFFSVIIATHNRAGMLEKAIQSVFGQTINDYELIIVDDASTDKTQKIITQYKDKVKNIRLKKNMGLAQARNQGIESAEGEWLVFLDDDDKFLPDRLEKQQKQIKEDKNKYQVYYCGTRKAREGKVIDAIPELKGRIWPLLMQGWTPPVSAQCFRQDVLKKINGYDTDIISVIDHDLWMKLGVEDYKTGIVTKALVEPDLTHHNRGTHNFHKRIKGVKQFLTKREKDITRLSGAAVYKKFYKCYLAREYRKFAEINLVSKNSCKKNKYIMQALYYDPFDKNNWLVLFNFIPKILIKIKKINKIEPSLDEKYIKIPMGFTIRMK